jgi:hypothetical protein
MKKFGVFILVTGLSGSSVWAAASPGTTAAEILKVGVGARAIGMGEAYTAQADDVSSLYWNPAGLALMQERQASFMYDQGYQNLKYSNGAVGIPLENGAIGASLSYLGFGQIAGFDQQGNSIGDQTAYNAVGTVGAAWLGNQWSAGMNLKGIKEKLADVSANGFAVDAGVNVIYPKPVLGGTIRLAAVVQNLGGGIKLLQQSDPLPTDWKVGVAAVQMMDRKLNLSLDYGKPKDLDSEIAMGVEYWVCRFIALRTGYVSNHTEGSGMRAGLGLKIKGVSFDYAYQGQGELGISNRYEMSFKFGEPRPILSPEQRKIYEQAKAAARAERYEQAILLYDSLLETQPDFKPARRQMEVVMGKMEGRQSEMAASQGKSFNPATATGTRKPTLPELDDLESLLNLGTPKAANPKAPTQPSASDLEVK